MPCVCLFVCVCVPGGLTSFIHRLPHRHQTYVWEPGMTQQVTNESTLL